MVNIFILQCSILSGFQTITEGLFSLSGKLRYANNSNYKNDVMIRKEVRRIFVDFSHRSYGATRLNLSYLVCTNRS